jgi:hypothetical protein
MCNVGKVKLIYLMMQETYTTESAPEAVDGYLGTMVSEQPWRPLFSENYLQTAADFVAGMVGENAKHVEPDSTPTIFSNTAGNSQTKLDISSVCLCE